MPHSNSLFAMGAAALVIGCSSDVKTQDRYVPDFSDTRVKLLSFTL